MLRISPGQLAAFDAAVLDKDTAWIAEQVRARLAPALADVPRGALHAAAASTVARGRALEITERADLVSLLEVSLSLVGHAFDTDPLHPELAALLARRDGLFVHPALRVEACLRAQRAYGRRLLDASPHAERLRAYVAAHPLTPASLTQPPLAPAAARERLAAELPEKLALHPDLEPLFEAATRALAAQGFPPSRLSSDMAIVSLLLGHAWFSDPAASPPAPESLSLHDRVLSLDRTQRALTERALKVAEATRGLD